MATIDDVEAVCDCEDMQVSDSDFKSAVMWFLCNNLSSSVGWTSCLEYVDGANPAVRFTRVFSRSGEGTTTSTDYDYLTGDEITVPGGATITPCGA